MLTEDLSAPATTIFRTRIRSILEREANGLRPRDVVILAVDGIPYDLARQAWPQARTEKLAAVFPTTSSTGWLSSLTGLGVDEHGIPGVVFRTQDGGGLINLFEFRGELKSPATENVFSDAAGLGYVPLAIVGDLEAYDCSWRELLLSHAQRIEGHRFWTLARAEHEVREPDEVCRNVREAISGALRQGRDGSPVLVWCFLEPDRHIHRYGYDERVVRFLELIEEAAVELAHQGGIVVAHADHGLTRTTNEPEIERVLERLSVLHGFAIGGAGRARWLYTRSEPPGELAHDLARDLPESVRVVPADTVFAAGSLARGRVGEIVLIAEGEGFLTSPGYEYDHGSCTDVELSVPLSEWCP